MAQTSFAMDESTQRALDELKSFFGVRTNSAVIKRALALAQVAQENADDNKQLTIVDGKHKREKKIIMLGGGI